MLVIVCLYNLYAILKYHRNMNMLNKILKKMKNHNIILSILNAV